MGIDLIAYLMILGAVLALIYQWLGLFFPILIGILVLIIFLVPMKYLSADYDDDDDE